MKRKNVVFLLSAFMIAIFLVSLIPTTVANTNSAEEEPKAISIGIGTTEDKFTKTDLIKVYTIDLTPGWWNLTLEIGNVSGEVGFYQLREQFSPYLDDYTKSWTLLDYSSFSELSIESLLVPVTASGKFMTVFSFGDIVSEENWADSYHLKFYVSKTDPAATSNGNVNVHVEEDTGKMYPFTVATSGWYNMTWTANNTAFGFLIVDEKGDFYEDWGGDWYGQDSYYFNEDLTYYYIIGAGVDVNVNFTLSSYPLAGTISGSSLIVHFEADEYYKLVSWTGLPEGLYQITINQTTPDVYLSLRSYSPTVDNLGLIDDNITIFLSPMIVNDWSQAVFPGFMGGDDEFHWSTYVAYSPDNSGFDFSYLLAWSNEAIGIELWKFSPGAVSVNLTVTPLEIETLEPTTSSAASRDSVTVTANNTLSETAFKVLKFDAEFGFEYDIMVEPVTDSHEGGVGVDSILVTPEGEEGIHAYGGTNFTAYYETIGGVFGSSETQTFYIIADVDTSGPSSEEWGTLIFTLTEVEPEEIEVGDEATKTLTYKDYFHIYQVELKKDKEYSFEISMDENSFGALLLVIVGEDGKMPDVEAGTDSFVPMILGDSVIGTIILPLFDFELNPSFSNQISVQSLEDQTVYVALVSFPVEGLYGEVSATLKVSEMEEPFGFEGVLAYIVLGLIPAALIIGLLIGKKTA